MPRINDEHIITIDGKPYVKYGGLLETAHRSGLKDLQVKLIQSPSRENGCTAVCEATAVIKTRSREKVYVEIGDASPASIGDPKLVPHAIRIAATRAKARALRDALHISICSVEELTIGNGSAPEASAASSPAKAPQPDKVTEPQLRVLRMQAEQLGLRDEDCTRFNTMTKKEASETISAFNRQLNMARVG